MLNKEGILFTTVIVFFAILYLVQLITIGFFITQSQKKK
ncbi:hypothetical protein SAMN04487762_2789 [Polaribacter sp. Hel1_33_78]|jgi:uncharacterized protein YneF (UPF0154 family)|nr:hypothetical protein PHEL49_0067 [Polaribacter sp. Hel1_33_49]PKV63696.1 hypothetical protein ATE90_0062 [Polaribacter sp. Hel1_33_96]SDU26581.1 hypothetical protein SAMN04487762_2789 [Polaribacter sp. Hel1_33_78]